MHNVCRQILNFHSQSQDKLKKKIPKAKNEFKAEHFGAKTFSFAYRKIFKEKGRQRE